MAVKSENKKLSFLDRNFAWIITLAMLIAMLLAAAALGFIITSAGAWIDCTRYGWATDRETKVTLGVCYVKTDSGWYEKSQLRSAE